MFIVFTFQTILSFYKDFTQQYYYYRCDKTCFNRFKVKQAEINNIK